MKKRGLVVANWSHHIDHLIPICHLLRLPLLVMTEAMRDCALRYYPPDARPVDVTVGSDPDVDYLAGFEVLFHTGRIPRTFLNQLPGRALRCVCVPHGWSDKAAWLKWMALEDVFLAYGPRTLEMMAEEGTSALVNRHVMAGNQRLKFYRSHQAFFDDLVEQDLFRGLDQGRETILYAPTWHDPERSSSFFPSCDVLVKRLPEAYNLLVKIHPMMTHLMARQVEEVVDRYRTNPRVRFIPDYPLIYPILSRASIYVGDRSSVGYDFLAFGRPMLFLMADSYSPARAQTLDECGTVLRESEFGTLYEKLEETRPFDEARFGAVRKRVYQAAFAPEPPDTRLVRAIDEACQGDRENDDFALPADFLSYRQSIIDAIAVKDELGRPRPWCRFFSYHV